MKAYLIISFFIFTIIALFGVGNETFKHVFQTTRPTWHEACLGAILFLCMLILTMLFIGIILGDKPFNGYKQ